MKYCLTIFLVIIGFTASAQTDSISVSLPDSLGNKVQLKKLDSLEHSFSVKSDSLREAYVQQKEKLGKWKHHYLDRIDSLKRVPTLPDNPLDSLKLKTSVTGYTQKVDSVDQQLASLEARTTAKLDSLKGKVNQQIKKLKLPKEADTKIAALSGTMQLILRVFML